MDPELSQVDDMAIEDAAMTIVAEVHEEPKFYSKYIVILAQLDWRRMTVNAGLGWGEVTNRVGFAQARGGVDSTVLLGDCELSHSINHSL